MLQLTSRCAAGSPCTESYRLAVPRHTAVVLNQPCGHVVLSGLASALRITAASADISAAGSSRSITARVTSGELELLS